jgi:hypothetical protein
VPIDSRVLIELDAKFDLLEAKLREAERMALRSGEKIEKGFGDAVGVGLSKAAVGVATFAALATAAEIASRPLEKINAESETFAERMEKLATLPIAPFQRFADAVVEFLTGWRKETEQIIALEKERKKNLEAINKIADEMSEVRAKGREEIRDLLRGTAEETARMRVEDDPLALSAIEFAGLREEIEEIGRKAGLSADAIKKATTAIDEQEASQQRMIKLRELGIQIDREESRLRSFRIQELRDDRRQLQEKKRERLEEIRLETRAASDRVDQLRQSFGVFRTGQAPGPTPGLASAIRALREKQQNVKDVQLQETNRTLKSIDNKIREITARAG